MTGREPTEAGLRIRDLILTYPDATWPEIAELGAREGIEVARGTYASIRIALQYDGYELPALAIGQPSQRKNRKPIPTTKVPKLYPRPPKKPRCPTCGQVLKKKKGSHGS